MSRRESTCMLLIVVLTCLLIFPGTVWCGSLDRVLKEITDIREKIDGLEMSDDPGRFDKIEGLKSELAKYAGMKVLVGRGAKFEKYDSKNRVLYIKPEGWGEDEYRLASKMNTHELLEFKRSFGDKLFFTVRIDKELSPVVTRIMDERERFSFRPVKLKGGEDREITILSTLYSAGGKLTTLGPEGKTIMFVNVQGRVITLSALTGRKLWETTLGEEPYASLISSNGNRAVIITRYGRLYMLSMKDGKIQNRVKLKGRIRALTFSPDNRFVSVGFQSGKVEIVDLETGKVNFKGNHNGSVTSLDFSSDGRYLFSGGEDSKIKVVYLPEMELAWQIPVRAVPEVIRVLPSGDAISALINFNYLGIWNMDLWTIDIAWRFRSHVTSFDFSSDGEMLACVFDNNRLKLYERKSGRKIKEMAQNKALNRVRFIPGKKLIVLADIAGNVQFIDMTDQTILSSIKLGSPAIKIATDRKGDIMSILCSDSKIYVLYVESLYGALPLLKTDTHLAVYK